MAINENNGKFRSERTAIEVNKILQDEINSLSADEREFLSLAMRELSDPAFRGLSDATAGGGPPRLIDALSDAEYARPLVDIRTFVKDPYYLGNTADMLYPKLVDDLEELFNGGYREAIFCLHPDTPIPLTDGSVATIEELSVRWMHDPVDFEVFGMKNGMVIKTMATAPRMTGIDDVYSISLTDQSWFVANARHQMVMINGEKKMVKDFVAGDEIFPFNSSSAVIDSISFVGRTDVYCMTVPETGNFAILTRVSEGLSTQIAGVFSSNTGAIGIGKCLKGDTILYDTSSGTRRRVDELGEFSTASMTPNGVFESAKATSFYSGQKECLELVLDNGAEITLSADHKVFTHRGWVEAGLLREDDMVATPRILPDPDVFYDIDEDELKLVGYLMADGGCTGDTTFTNANPEIVLEFTELVRKVGDSSGNRPCQQHIIPDVKPKKWQGAGKAITYSATGIRWLVNSTGCNERAKDKQIPAEFYGLSKKNIGIFLNRFIACDGGVEFKHNRVDIGLASEKLIDDLKFLLLRIGVMSRKSFKMATIKQKDGTKKEYDSWRLMISEASNVIKLLDGIGEVVGKTEECRALRSNCESVRLCPNADIVPLGQSELREAKEALKAQGRLAWSDFKCPKKQFMSRGRFEKFCENTGYNGEHSWHARSDIAWEYIKSISPVGLIDVYDVSVPGNQSLIGNNIVVHNSFIGSIVLCRTLYEMSCLRDVHRSFGLAKDTNISIVAFSVSEALAIKVIFENVATKLNQSPYFLENFPFEETKTELRFPHNIWIAARATTDTSALGLNVVSFVMDEGNFLEGVNRGKASLAKYGDKDKAQHLYEQLQRRIKSRFSRQGKLPGIMLLLSSKRTKEDFTQRRIDESRTDPDVFVRDYATHELNPDRFSTKMFSVLVGNDMMPSRVLQDEEVPSIREMINNSKSSDLLIVEMPEDWRMDFEKDVDQSIRDIAGISTVSISPFINQRDKIDACINQLGYPHRLHPFEVESWDQSKPGTFIWERLARQIKVRDGASVALEWQPLYYPQYIRHFHIDPSLTGDHTGFTMGCIFAYTNVNRRNRDTQEIYSEPAPLIWIDFMLDIAPPKGGEIDHGMNRGLVYQLQSHGFPIGLGTMDQWNCIVAGSLVPTNRGMIPIEQVRIGDMVQSRVGPRPVLDTFSYPVAPTVKITTQDNDVLEGTPLHQVEVQVGWTGLVDNEFGRTRNPRWEWRRMDQLKIGDVVHMSAGTELDSPDMELKGSKEEFGYQSGRSGFARDFVLPSHVTEGLAEFIGLIWGDGDMGDGEKSGHIRLTTHIDDLIDVERIFSNLFGGIPTVEKSAISDKCVSLRFGAVWMVRWLRSNGFNKPNVPTAIMMSSKKIKAAFLRGLFSADGNVGRSDGEIQLYTSEYELAYQVKNILQSDFGIQSCLFSAEKKYEGQKKLPGWHGGLAWTISIRGPRRKYSESIGFCYRSKQDELNKHIEIIGRRKFIRITKIEYGAAPVFDIQVADDPSYVANGFVSHNSAASLQKFAQRGIEAKVVSVDKPMDAYETLKEALYEGRVFIYDYKIVLNQLKKLQHDRIKGKVDHPPHGAKDVSDSLAAVVYTLTTEGRHAPMAPMRGISEHSDPIVEQDVKAVAPEDDPFNYLPFLKG